MWNCLGNVCNVLKMLRRLGCYNVKLLGKISTALRVDHQKL